MRLVVLVVVVVGPCVNVNVVSRVPTNTRQVRARCESVGCCCCCGWAGCLNEGQNDRSGSSHSSNVLFLRGGLRVKCRDDRLEGDRGT